MVVYLKILHRFPSKLIDCEFWPYNCLSYDTKIAHGLHHQTQSLPNPRYTSMKIGLRFLWPSTSNFQSDHFESITIHFNYSLSLFKLGNNICNELKSVFFFQAARNWKKLKFIASEIVSAYSLSINRCWFVYSSSSIELERKLLYFPFKQLKIKTSYFLEW